jgi:anaerobic magnesium-protoporphyrin IX monomethyl ester cyclase
MIDVPPATLAPSTPTSHPPRGRGKCRARVALVAPAWEYLSVEFLGGVLGRAGHEVMLAYDPQLFNDSFVGIPALARLFHHGDEVADRVAGWEPDLVAFTVLSRNMDWATDLAARVRSRTRAPIVFGGNHPTSAPEETLRRTGIDAVVVGEGEWALLAMADRVAAGEDPRGAPNTVWIDVDGTVRRNPLLPLETDIGRFGWPRKDLYWSENELFRIGYFTVTARGCIHACSYCYPHVYRNLYGVGAGRFYRRRSVDDVLAELAWARSEIRPSMIRFSDDTFSFQPRWIEEFAERYPREVAIPFWCFVTPDSVSPEVADALQRAGCVEAEMGVQTLDDRVRRDVIHRTEENEDVARAIQIFHERGMAISADFILNVPGQTEDQLEGMVRFFLAHRPTRVNTFWMDLYPGTDILAIAEREGYISAAQARDIAEGREVKGVIRGGWSRDRVSEQFQTLVFLMNFLPSATVERMLRLHLHRWLPYLGHFFTYAAHYGMTYLTGRAKNDLYSQHLRARYRHYIGRQLRRWIRLT